MFERCRLQILCLVDDKDSSSSIGELAIQKILQLLEKNRIVPVERLAKRHQDPLQQFLPALRGVRDQADGDRRADLLEQMPDQGGLAGPYFTGNDGEAGVVHDAELQHRERHGMHLAPVNQVGVGEN